MGTIWCFSGRPGRLERVSQLLPPVSGSLVRPPGIRAPRRSSPSVLRFFFLYVLLLAALCCSGSAAWAQLSTEDHVAEPGFWPTKAQASQSEFAGPAACARCHAGIASVQRESSMRRTAMHSDAADLLHQHPDLGFRFEQDLFRIQTSSQHGVWNSQYTVTDVQQTLSYPLLWIFGTGRVGQSYLFKKEDGNVYEARVTFFQSLKNIGFTPARALETHSDLTTAMGRQVATPELIRCFNCHATAVNVADQFNEKGLIAGVTCEACHGPSAAHVQMMGKPAQSGAGDDHGTFDPSHLSPTESVEFCGSCHGSWWDVKLAHVTGPSTARSAPYRLVTSKCWGKEGDPRLVCTACHDPHRELQTDISAYDKACLRCHAVSGTAVEKVHGAPSSAGNTARAPACPVATSRCASCHMPQVNVPEMQNTFTDHRIRVVKAGEAFKD